MAECRTAASGRYEWAESPHGPEHLIWVRGALASVLGITHAKSAAYANQLPCSQPTSISAVRAQRLRKPEYMLTPKADGTRYFIMFCSMEGVPLAIAISRAMKLTILDVDVHPMLYNGTIIDCELMSPNLLLGFDILQHQGESLRKRTFVYRQQRLYALESTLIHGIPLQVKKFWPFDELGVARVNETDYPTDGYILQHIREFVTIGRSRQSYRVKTHETIDVLFKDGTVHLSNAGVLVPAGQRLVITPLPSDAGVWECAVGSLAAGIITAAPTICRSDKEEPNDISTLDILVRALTTDAEE